VALLIQRIAEGLRHIVYNAPGDCGARNALQARACTAHCAGVALDCRDTVRLGVRWAEVAAILHAGALRAGCYQRVHALKLLKVRSRSSG
jgi:hypothetical protein